MGYNISASRQKYGAKPTTVDGIRFASRLEAARYGELKLMERAGMIRELVTQKRYPLVVGGVLVATYVADFVYVDAQGQTVVEDTKSPPTQTAEYRIKRRLMLALHCITISEVMARPKRSLPRSRGSPSNPRKG